MELNDAKAEITRKFAEKEKDHTTRIEALYAIDGFDASGLLDRYPEILDKYSKDGEIRLNFWEEFINELAKKPKITNIIRFTEKDVLFDAPTRIVVTDKTWFRSFKDLTVDKIKFFTSPDKKDFNGIAIDHPSVVVTQDGTFTPFFTSILFDERFKMWNKIEEAASPTLLYASEASRTAILTSTIGLENDTANNVYSIVNKATHNPQFEQWLAEQSDAA